MQCGQFPFHSLYFTTIIKGFARDCTAAWSGLAPAANAQSVLPPTSHQWFRKLH